MKQTLVDQVVSAVLYEGYLLYPYRPSVKSRQRWTFGGLYPRSYSEAQEGSDACTMQAECLLEGEEDTALAVTVRFLHLMDRRVAELTPPLAEWPERGEPALRFVGSLEVAGRPVQSWQEAV